MPPKIDEPKTPGLSRADLEIVQSGNLRFVDSPRKLRTRILPATPHKKAQGPPAAAQSSHADDDNEITSSIHVEPTDRVTQSGNSGLTPHQSSRDKETMPSMRVADPTGHVSSGASTSEAAPADQSSHIPGSSSSSSEQSLPLAAGRSPRENSPSFARSRLEHSVPRSEAARASPSHDTSNAVQMNSGKTHRNIALQAPPVKNDRPRLLGRRDRSKDSVNDSGLARQKARHRSPSRGHISVVMIVLQSPGTTMSWLMRILLRYLSRILALQGMFRLIRIVHQSPGTTIL